MLPPPIPSPASGGGCGWGQRPHPQGAAELDLASVGVSPPNFSFVLSFVIAGLDPAIHAEISLAERFHQRLRRLKLRMDHRHRRPKDAVLRTAMSGGDESEIGVTVASHTSDAKSHRENAVVRLTHYNILFCCNDLTGNGLWMTTRGLTYVPVLFS